MADVNARWPGALLVAALLAMAVGCGEPPADGRYLGDVQGELVIRVPGGQFIWPDAWMTVVWTEDLTRVDPGAWVPQGEPFRPLPSGNRVIRLFTPPPPDAGPSARGLIVLFEGESPVWRADRVLQGVGDDQIIYVDGQYRILRDDACCGQALDACLADCRGDDCWDDQILIHRTDPAEVRAPCQ